MNVLQNCCHFFIEAQYEKLLNFLFFPSADFPLYSLIITAAKRSLRIGGIRRINLLDESPSRHGSKFSGRVIFKKRTNFWMANLFFLIDIFWDCKVGASQVSMWLIRHWMKRLRYQIVLELKWLKYLVYIFTSSLNVLFVLFTKHIWHGNSLSFLENWEEHC